MGVGRKSVCHPLPMLAACYMAWCTTAHISVGFLWVVALHNIYVGVTSSGGPHVIVTEGQAHMLPSWPLLKNEDPLGCVLGGRRYYQATTKEHDVPFHETMDY